MKNAKRRRLMAQAALGENAATNPPEKKQIPVFLSWKWLLGVLAVSLIVSFLLYGNTLHGKFVYDDSYFSQRKDLRDLSSLVKVWTQPLLPDDLVSGGGFYRPLWTATIALNFILFGTDPFSFHVVSVILYALVIFMVFLVSLQVSRKKILAAAAALFFAFLPVHTEVVANIKSRDELLSALFILASWLVFSRASFHQAGRKIFYMWLSAALFFAAILSKESVVFIPFFYFLVWFVEEKPKLRTVIFSAIPFALFYFAYFILRLFALKGYAFTGDNAYFIMNQLQDVSLFTRISTGFELVWLYLFKIFIPYNLSASYDYNVIPTIAWPFANMMGFLGVFTTIAIFGLVLYRHTPRTVRIGTLFFIFSYAVISKVFYAKGAIFGERLIFLPSIGVALIVGWLVARGWHWNKTVTAILSATCLIVYAAVTIPRNEVWRDPQVFFEQMVKDAPNSVQARTALARGYFNNGKLRASYAQAMAGYEIYPDHPGLLGILGKLAYIEKDYAHAEYFFTRAMKYEPHNFDHNQFYALTLAKEGRFREALDHVKDEYTKRKENSDLRFIMALGLYRTGKTKEALSDQYVWTTELDRAEREQVLRTF